MFCMIRAAPACPKALTSPVYCRVMPSGAPGKSSAAIRTSKGWSLEPSCMALPAPTIPLAPEITSAPRSLAGPNT